MALEEIIAVRVQKVTGQIPTSSEVTEAADALMSFVQILIEADKEIRIKNGTDHRNPNHPS